MSDSGEHQALRKNGHEHQQDRLIQKLTDDFHSHIQTEEQHHASIERGLSIVSSSMDKYVFAGRIVWVFLGLISALVVGYQASLDYRIRNVETRVDANTAKLHMFEERFQTIGQKLDISLAQLRDDVREIRHTIESRFEKK